MQDRHRVMGDVRVLFQDGDHKCSYVPPRGWTSHGTKERLSLEANDRCHSTAVIEQVSLTAPESFDEKTLKAIQDEVINALPKESRDIKVSIEKNPLGIDSHDTAEVTVNYYFLERDRMKTVLFVDLGATQL